MTDMASQRPILLLLSAAAVLAASGCAPAMQNESSAAGSDPRASTVAEPAQPVLLTRPAPEGANYHAIGAEGTLALENGCFFLRFGESRFLLIWPDGTRWDAAGEVILFRDQRLRIGQRVVVNGRSAPPAPDFDARGCDTSKTFWVNPWRAEITG
ncbi:MAG TPA: hypothetical protein VEZ20_14520 [Allosphingosinicella sp.]|jgi:hypothetical protein|nr:hypothetical protein [Allosphingosinicella sp.]